MWCEEIRDHSPEPGRRNKAQTVKLNIQTQNQDTLRRRGMSTLPQNRPKLSLLHVHAAA